MMNLRQDISYKS